MLIRQPLQLAYIILKYQVFSLTTSCYFFLLDQVGSGYSLKELAKLCDTLNPYWRKFDANNLPENIIFTPGIKVRYYTLLK